MIIKNNIVKNENNKNKNVYTNNFRLKRMVMSLGAPFLVLFLFFISLIVSFEANNKDIRGYEIFSVSSDSMNPAIKKGSLAVIKKVKGESIGDGDIIAFSMPTDINKTVLHRVQKVELNEMGEEVFLTKGDSNNTLDPWGVQEYSIKGIEILSIPFIGYILNFIRSPTGMFLFFIIPSVYIIFVEIQKLKEIAVRKRGFMKKVVFWDKNKTSRRKEEIVLREIRSIL